MRLKRIILIFVLLAHVFSTVGVFARTHFCEDYLTELTFLTNNHEPACCECTGIDKSNCCEDIFVKSVNKTEFTIRSIPDFDLKNKSAGWYFNLPSHKFPIHFSAHSGASFFLNPLIPSKEQMKAIDVVFLRL